MQSLSARTLISRFIKKNHPIDPQKEHMPINPYGKQLTQKMLELGKHRAFIGGLWDEMGELQFNFLKQHGLLPEHNFVDIGCGALRGGVHFVRYLQAGKYHGADINASLLDAGKMELAKLNLQDKKPNLMTSDKFEITRFGVQFDYGIAQSLFTHLMMNNIVRCLQQVQQSLKPDGTFFATFYSAPVSGHIETIKQELRGPVTYYDADPYHNSFEEIQSLAKISKLNVELIGDWDHPRDQKMLAFTHLAK